MGYSYQGRSLCCDVCGTAGARKHRCPYNYCPALACCAACWKRNDENHFKHKHNHERCRARSDEMRLRDEKAASLLAEGKALRRAAANVGKTGAVVVLFRDAHNVETCFFMGKATYDALPLLTPATPDDYRAFGTVLPCTADFQTAMHRPETIDVPAL
jgi:hypothetical protein